MRKILAVIFLGCVVGWNAYAEDSPEVLFSKASYDLKVMTSSA